VPYSQGPSEGLAFADEPFSLSRAGTALDEGHGFSRAVNNAALDGFSR
jgi:hypothetical protein